VECRGLYQLSPELLDYKKVPKTVYPLTK